MKGKENYMNVSNNSYVHTALVIKKLSLPWCHFTQCQLVLVKDTKMETFISKTLNLLGSIIRVLVNNQGCISMFNNMSALKNGRKEFHHKHKNIFTSSIKQELVSKETPHIYWISFYLFMA